MQEQEEIWKDIPGYEGYYQASNLGVFDLEIDAAKAYQRKLSEIK